MSQQSVLQMSQIQEQVLKRAISMLEGMKCSYAIIDPLGGKHGSLEVKERSSKGGARKYPHAERSKYARLYIESMSVGDVVNIPFGQYEGLECQSSIMSASHRLWGKGSVTTTINRPNKVVEIMRIL